MMPPVVVTHAHSELPNRLCIGVELPNENRYEMVESKIHGCAWFCDRKP